MVIGYASLESTTMATEQPEAGKLRRLGFLGLMSLQSRQAQIAARHSSFGYRSELGIIEVFKKRIVFGLAKH